jgi:hypothetical protein
MASGPPAARKVAPPPLGIADAVGGATAGVGGSSVTTAIVDRSHTIQQRQQISAVAQLQRVPRTSVRSPQAAASRKSVRAVKPSLRLPTEAVQDLPGSRAAQTSRLAGKVSSLA